MQKLLRSQILEVASVISISHGPEGKKRLISFLSVALRKENAGDLLNCKLFFIQTFFQVYLSVCGLGNIWFLEI